MGLCPFTARRRRRFSVNRDKGFFYCYGCGAGGDVIKFLSSTRKSDSTMP